MWFVCLVAKTDGTEEEEVEQVDEESTHTDDYDSGIQMNFSKVKHKLRSSSSQAPVTQSTRKDRTCIELMSIFIFFPMFLPCSYPNCGLYSASDLY